MPDLYHPYLRPLWIRIAITAFVFGWGIFEFATGAIFWGVLFLAGGLGCIHGFFISFNPPEADENAKGRKDG